MKNSDSQTVSGFGDEWERFDQARLDTIEHQDLFERYFYIFPWGDLPLHSVGFDMGCGSGRWAKLVADRVGLLHCIDPSSALNVAKRNLEHKTNCIFHDAAVGDPILPFESMDFGYSLGVLHHIPDTQRGINDCVSLLKPGAPFLIYLYYSFDNRPVWFRFLWQGSEVIRRFVCRLPYSSRYFVTQLIAIFFYWPLAKTAWLLEKIGLTEKIINSFPLASYRKLSFYTMRTDALDRFGTPVEKRFSRLQIEKMLKEAGLERINFSNNVPFWCAIGFKSER